MRRRVTERPNEVKQQLLRVGRKSLPEMCWTTAGPSRRAPLHSPESEHEEQAASSDGRLCGRTLPWDLTGSTVDLRPGADRCIVGKCL